MDEPASLKDFKDWFEKKDLSEFLVGRHNPNSKYIGKLATAKVSEKKLMEKIETESDAAQLVSEFVYHGGKVLAFEGLQAQIETPSGKFSIPRFCIKIKKD